MDRLVFLALAGNELTGIIPDTLGDLNALQSLRIANNTIVGEVPAPLCDLKNGSLESIVVDCNIGCSCCTDECHGQPSSAPVTPIPTQSPSPQPTSSPTSSPSSPSSTPTSVPTTSIPSSSPTQCVAELTVIDEANCIPEGDAIRVSFENCQPENDDWIGIYDWDADPEDLDTGYLWSWACGNQNCRTEATSDEVVFNQNHIAKTTSIWPLKKGWYIAFLIRRNPGGPYVYVELQSVVLLVFYRLTNIAFVFTCHTRIVHTLLVKNFASEINAEEL